MVGPLQAAYLAAMQRTSAVNRSGYESLLRIYRESDLSQEKARILGNLEKFVEFMLELVHLSSM